MGLFELGQKIEMTQMSSFGTWALFGPNNKPKLKINLGSNQFGPLSHISPLSFKKKNSIQNALKPNYKFHQAQCKIPLGPTTSQLTQLNLNGSNPH